MAHNFTRLDVSRPLLRSESPDRAGRHFFFGDTMTRYENLADAIARYRRADVWNVRCWDAKTQINQIRDLLDLPRYNESALVLAAAESALRQLINDSDAERAAAAAEIHRIAKTKEPK